MISQILENCFLAKANDSKLNEMTFFLACFLHYFRILVFSTTSEQYIVLIRKLFSIFLLFSLSYSILAFNLTNKQNSDKSPTTPLSTSREIQLLREQLDQQSIQTRQALAQLMMVREQLISETNARIEAQVRDHEIYNIIKIYI
jgi:hypothetical protein